jgi:HSP20 family protein
VVTSLTRWNPIDEIANMWPREFFGRDLLSHFRPDGGVDFEWRPRCDVTEADDAVMIHAELPGVDAKDMDVAIDKGMLVIRGEKRTEKKEEEKGQTYRERFFGSFERRFSLPPDTDENAIKASMKDGVLEVRIPKSEQKGSQRKRIEVKRS